MEFLLPLAAKSLLIAGAALLLLRLMHKRSAADRSLVAHLGLGALFLLPVVTFAFPPLEVAGPAFMAEPVAQATAAVSRLPTAAPEVAANLAPFPGKIAPAEPVEPVAFTAAIDWAFWAYAAPAAVLVLLTLIALLRLIPLKARAHVLVEPHWLSALAHAQRRMGFKSGTALLTSDDIRSPISWGLMRPVILLNRDAADAHAEAEAIIAHELAHVAGLDWAKLLLARVTVAVFWFNPLVWLLAREAHQLREEAADDAVLGSDIEDTEYANLLVGIAKHECRGLLLGAHGVAPAKNSLARRVKRVLDSASVRAPGGWRWSAAAAFFAAGMAVPVAALQIIAPTVDDARAEGRIAAASAAPAAAGAATATRTAVAAADTASAAATRSVEAAVAAAEADSDFDIDIDPRVFERLARVDEAFASASAARARAAASVRSVASVRAVANARTRASDDAVEEAIAAKIHGVTPEYARAIRESSPALARIDMEDLVALKIHRVTPETIRELQRLGYRNLDPDDLTAAAVHGVNGDYARSMARAGYPRVSLEELVEMKIFGVTPDYIEKMRRAGYRNLSAEQIIEMKTFGVDPADLRRAENGDP